MATRRHKIFTKSPRSLNQVKKPQRLLRKFHLMHLSHLKWPPSKRAKGGGLEEGRKKVPVEINAINTLITYHPVPLTFFRTI
jgi:hypothetical protein